MSKPCHNCRRRRLRCDFSIPSCFKCSKNGETCLGYGPLLRWVQGQPSQAAAKATPPRARKGNDVGDDGSQGGQANEEGSTALVAATQPTVQPAQGLTLLPGLLDPFFRNLPPTSRRYLDYFSKRVCVDLVAHDQPESNPFRQLIPMAKQHPFLFHIIIAMSAIHLSNVARQGTVSMGKLAGGSLRTRCDAAAPPLARQSLVHALEARQTAMRLLGPALENIDQIGGDLVLTAVLFFINFDLIDYGTNEWRAHVGGAVRIMGHIAPEAALARIASPALRDYVISDCFIYYCLGSTFTPSALDGTETTSAHLEDLLPIIERAAANSYLCCPPEILRVLLSASQLANAASTNINARELADTAAVLIKRALAFDVYLWASNMQEMSSKKDRESRIHVASAHRAAACLYTAQGISTDFPVLSCSEREVLVSQVVTHLDCIGMDDPHFKATSWPTFVAGVESDDEQVRAWALHRLDELWRSCPWGFLTTALDTLYIVWKVRDATGAEKSSKRSWVQVLRGLGRNFVVV